jgi:hypothetical protein
MKKVNLLIALFLILFFAISIGAKYLKFLVQQDYLLVIETSCDPTSEACFVFECENLATEGCEPYKYIEVQAKPFSDNNLEYSDYGLQCEELDFPCEVIECSSENTVDGESCIE